MPRHCSFSFTTFRHCLWNFDPTGFSINGSLYSSLRGINGPISSTSHLIIPFSAPSCKSFLKTIYSSLACAFCSFFLNTAQAKQLLQNILNPGKVFILHLVGVFVFHLQLFESFQVKDKYHQ